MYLLSGEYTITFTDGTYTASLPFTVPDHGQDELIQKVNENGGEMSDADKDELRHLGAMNPLGAKSGNPTIDTVTGNDPVEMITGAFDWSYSDLSIFGDAQMDFTRSYNSRQARLDVAGLGSGWSHSFRSEEHTSESSHQD